MCSNPSDLACLGLLHSGPSHITWASPASKASQVQAVVCAQHGRVVNRVKVPCRRTIHGNMKQLPPKANSERVTDWREEGEGKSAGRWTRTAYQGRRDATSWHNTTKSLVQSRRFRLGESASGGKCGGRAVKQRVLTWGDPAGQLGGESAEAIVPSSEPGAGISPSKHEHRKTRCREGPNRTGTVRPRGGHCNRRCQ